MSKVHYRIENDEQLFNKFHNLSYKVRSLGSLFQNEKSFLKKT